MVNGVHDKGACLYYERRGLMCPYCLSGSKPVDRSVILEKVKDGVK
jgi:hypothetical protein